MRMIFPSAGAELDLLGLAEAYAYPRERWLRANFVSSADGAAYVDGRSGGLSSDGDKRIFGVLRVLADVVLVGAGTARVRLGDRRPVEEDRHGLGVRRPPVRVGHLVA